MSKRRQRAVEATAPPVGRGRRLASASAAMAEAAQAEALEAAAANSGKPGQPKVSTREGKRGLVLYVAPEMLKDIRKLAIENDMDVQGIGRRAIELLYEAYNRPMPGTAKPAVSKS